MNRALLLGVLAVSLPLSAAEKPNPVDYTLHLHVTASELEHFSGDRMAEIQILRAELEGKQLRLECSAMMADVHGIGYITYGLLPPGQYKAKPVAHKAYTPAYLNWDSYELLLPDLRTLNCKVVGLYE